MRLSSVLIVSLLACGGVAGCAADLAVDGYPADYVAPPVGVETYPRYEFHDGYAYYGNGGWYHQHGDRWVRYRQAPPELSNVTDDEEPEVCMSRRVTIFRHVAHLTSHAVGTSTAFCIAVGTILVWGALGPVFHFSDTWQLVINTGTTIVTFLMIFLVQNTQNRESESVSLKLDELIRAVDAARNEMLAIDDLDDAQLAALRVEFRKLGEKRPVRS